MSYDFVCPDEDASAASGNVAIPRARRSKSVDGSAYRLCVRHDEATSWENDGRCGAQLRGQPGVYCRKYPAENRTRCRLHGGASPTGADHPSYLAGRRSKYVVSQKAYDQVTTDLAFARIMFERAIGAGSSGAREGAEIRRCQRVYAELTRGKFLPGELPSLGARGLGR